MPVPLSDPLVFDLAVKACLEPDRQRLVELLEQLERYLLEPDGEAKPGTPVKPSPVQESQTPRRA